LIAILIQTMVVLFATTELVDSQQYN